MKSQTQEIDAPIVSSLIESWPSLKIAARKAIFKRLSRTEAEDLFLGLSASDQVPIFEVIPEEEKRSWIRILAPDDAADLVQKLPRALREKALTLLDEGTRREVTALLAYAEDQAGGLMNPRFVRLRPEMTGDEAISYLKAQARTQVETLYTAYVLDPDQRILGVVSFRDLFRADADRTVQQIMQRATVTVPENCDQRVVSRKFSQSGLTAIPVVDPKGRMQGIVTIDDIIGVAQKEFSKDILKMGGTEALDAPYFQVSMLQMIKKRAGWLAVLFVGEMFTATAMGYFEKEIAKAVVLALFIPLIISSGGNSGSQATTLIIRSLALGEVELKDWWRVLTREICSGLALGLILGTIGLIRIMVWPTRATLYGEHYALIALTVSGSLIGIVLWGSLAGSMLPFILRRLGFDPASASAPLVATIVDVTGIVIYFTVASLILGGTLL
ncbi:MAG: magnesium transporter [Methylotenera sp.]|nr:magnesium transporter [Oligoflexia bacterium]